MMVDELKKATVEQHQSMANLQNAAQSGFGMAQALGQLGQANPFNNIAAQQNQMLQSMPPPPYTTDELRATKPPPVTFYKDGIPVGCSGCGCAEGELHKINCAHMDIREALQRETDEWLRSVPI